MARGDKPLPEKIYRSQSTNEEGVSSQFNRLIFVLLRSVDLSLSQVRSITPEPLSRTNSFSISRNSFWYLIWSPPSLSLDGKNNPGLGRIWSFVSLVSLDHSRLAPSRESRNNSGRNFFGNEKCPSHCKSLSAHNGDPSLRRRDGKCEGRNERGDFWARESVKS